MATLFWMILILHLFAAYSQSGDDATATGEPIDTVCWSLITLKQSILICVLNDYDLYNCEKFATLCRKLDWVCSNATMKNKSFTFNDLSLTATYTLQIHLKEGRHQIQQIDLKKMVKITTPEIENATYKLDEADIHIRYQHDYVKTPHFQVEFWGNHTNNKQKVIVNYQQMSIGGDKLRDSEVYNIRVRAKPVDYFKGSWTEWSRMKSFKVNHNPEKDVPFLLYILLCPIPFVLVVTVFLVLRWKKVVKTYIFPDVPGPKSTLTEIHRQKAHLPVSFSPEMFKDILDNIYPVVYNEEKQFTPEFGDDQSDTTDSCDDEVVALKCSCPSLVCEKQNEDDQSLDLEISQLKLLDECVLADNPGIQSVTVLQRHSKDEIYVTMSSLFKTQ